MAATTTAVMAAGATTTVLGVFAHVDTTGRRSSG